MRSVLCSMLVGSAALAQAPATSPPPPATPAPAQSAQPSQPAQSAPARPAYTGPVVRASDRPAADTRDARVDMGGYRISMPGTPAPAPGPSSVVRADGAIVVPDNTLGPGLSLQQRNDLVNAQIRQEQARALFDERVAERALPDTRWGFIAPGGYRRIHQGGWDRGGGWYDGGPRRELVGPLTTTVTPSDQLGAQAQRNFAEAATPRVVEIERARSEAFLKAQRENAPGGK